MPLRVPGSTISGRQGGFLCHPRIPDHGCQFLDYPDSEGTVETLEVAQVEDKKLAAPLAKSQVEAAMRLYGYSESWQTVDGVFDSLHQSFPYFDQQSTLLKVTVVNALYSTNIYAVARMAEHVGNLIRARGSLPPDVQFVEQLATSHGLPGRFYSFASKFAHFFFDGEQFPIYDSYAVRMVTYHLGKAGCLNDKDHLYRSFVVNFNRLKESIDFPATNRELDRYLFLAGQYRAWKGLPPFKKPHAGISPEILRLFKDREDDASRFLGT